MELMPTIFIVFGYIFKFFSDDHSPIHVHVIKDGHEAKYNVEPISIIESLIEENVDVIKDCWQKYFKER